MKKTRALLNGMSAALLSLALAVPAWGQEVTVTMFHINDTHGRWIPGNNVIGPDTIAAINNATENSLLIDAGDTFHGIPFANLNRGADIVALMNAAGVDFHTPGNHEFNFGLDRLIELSEMAYFEFLSANIYIGGELLFTPTAIRELDGVRIGFFGLTTPDTAFLTAPANVQGVDFADIVETSEAAVAYLQEQGVDMIVAVAHLGYGQGLNRSGSLAQAVEGIDLIIDGHSHTFLEEGILVGDTLIVQVEDHGQYLGRVEAVFYDNELQSVTASVIDVAYARENFEPVSEITALIEDILAGQQEEMGVVVGYIGHTLYDDDIRISEMPLGNLIADATLYATGADIALQNGGGMRDVIAAGEITHGDIIAVLPFGNYVTVVEITPAVLRETLENGVVMMPEPSGRFPQIAGFSFTFDVEAAPGNRVVSIELGGEELDLEDTTTTLTMATNNFLASGGDEYNMLVDLPVVHFFPGNEEILIEFIATADLSQYTDVEGRINQVVGVAPAYEEEVAPEEATEEALEEAPEYVVLVPYVQAEEAYAQEGAYELMEYPSYTQEYTEEILVPVYVSAPVQVVQPHTPFVWWSGADQSWWDNPAQWWTVPHPLAQ